MDINYTVEFFTCWHCGSGLSAGADVDALVVRDSDGLPFIPGRTLKGLIREAVETLLQFEGNESLDTRKIFGGEGSEPEEFAAGEAFFSNAIFPEEDRQKIVADKLQDYLFSSLSNTAIGEDGCVREHYLRKTEVALPCTLTARILNVPDDDVELICRSLGFIKRLGVHRNRGLGRCKFTPLK